MLVDSETPESMQISLNLLFGVLLRAVLIKNCINQKKKFQEDDRGQINYHP